MSTVTAFTNVYYKRVTGTPRACFVCHKPTTTVLATAPATDFIYTCDAHLLDPGFATRIADPPPPEPSISADAIAKIKEEYEAAQKRKQEKAKEKGGDKDKKEKEENKADKDDGSGKDSKPTSPSPAPSGAKTPTHEKYALHRHMFALRVDEHRRRRQSKDAQTLAPRLPGAPTGNVG